MNTHTATRPRSFSARVRAGLAAAGFDETASILGTEIYLPDLDEQAFDRLAATLYDGDIAVTARRRTGPGHTLTVVPLGP